MLNFSVGPVQMDEEIRNIGREQIPYFRTKEFSEINLESEKIFNEFLSAPDGSRTIFLTGSGTAGLEASTANFFNQNDKVLIVNGGTFGHRLVQLCQIFDIKFEEIKLEYGKSLTKEILAKYDNKDFTAMFLQHHETSTGVLYDLDLVGSFCKTNNLFLCVDCISSFMADKIDMTNFNIDAVITGSQKGLALPPGMSFITVNNSAIERIQKNKVKSLYFDLKEYLKDGERGQTPFTPAVSVCLQLNKRLKTLKNNGGIENIINNTSEIAHYFRQRINKFPFSQFSDSPSNAVTSITLTNGKSAYDVFLKLKDKYNIFICPNGGDMADKIFRVGHIGYITKENIDELIQALDNLYSQGEL